MAASIPFAFEANHRVMQAGEYVIRADTDSGTLHVCEDGVYCASIPAIGSLAAGNATEVRLVFRKTDGRLLLRAVECVNGETLRLPDCESISNGEEHKRVAIPARLLTITVIPGLGPCWS